MKGLISYSKQMYDLNKDRNRTYILTFSICLAILFIYFNTFFNPIIQGEAYFYVLFLIVVSLITIGTLTHSFLTKKMYEIAILSISGGNLKHIVVYLTFQIMIILLKALPLGIIAALIINPILNSILYYLMNVDGSIFFISIEGFILSLIILIPLIIFLIEIVISITYKNDLLIIISDQPENTSKIPLMKVHVPYFLSWLLILASLYFIIKFPSSPQSVIFFSLFSLIGLNTIIKTTLSKIIEKIRLKLFFTKREMLIALGNTLKIIKSLKTLILSIFIVYFSIISLYSYTYLEELHPINHLPNMPLIIISFIILLVLINMNIYCKLINEGEHQKELFKTLYQIGFSDKEINKTIKNELKLLLLVISLFPMIFSFTLCISLKANFFQTFIKPTLLFLISLLIVLYLVYQYYIKLVFNNGGDNHD